MYATKILSPDIAKSESRKEKTLCAIGVLIRSRRRINVYTFCLVVLRISLRNMRQFDLHSA